MFARSGLIYHNEPTDGSQGIGLALIGAVKGYGTVIIMPDTAERHFSAPLFENE